MERAAPCCVETDALRLRRGIGLETMTPRVTRPSALALALTVLLLGGTRGCAGRSRGPGTVARSDGASGLTQGASAGPGELPAIRGDGSRAVAPIRFEGRRGTTLPITRLEIAARSVDPLAQVAMEIEIANPDPERVRGTLYVAVPADARVERFAVRDSTGWYEAKMVARPLPRPARLELPSDVAIRGSRATDELAIALEGIAPRGRMTIHLVWSRALARDGDRLHVPLRGLPPIGDLDVELWAAEAATDGALEMTPLRVRSRGVAPTMDLVGPAAPRRAGVRSGELAVARIVPLHHDHASALRGLTVLFDTSASRVLAHDAQVDALDAVLRGLAARLPGSTPLRIATYDQSTQVVFDATLADWDAGAARQLRRVRPAGASDLLGALEHIRAQRARGSSARVATHEALPVHDPLDDAAGDASLIHATFDRLLIVGDGVSTAGEAGREAVDTALEGLRDVGYERIDVLVDGTPRDRASLARLAHGLSRRGLLLDGTREDGAALSRRLVRDVTRVRLTAPDAAWAWPEVVEDVQASDEVVVWARIDPTLDDAGLSWLVTDEHGEARTLDIPYGSVHDASLLADAFAGAQVDALVAALRDASDQPLETRRVAYRRALELARARGVTSAFTAPELPPKAPARPLVAAMDLTHALNLVDARGVLVDLLDAGARGSRGGAPSAVPVSARASAAPDAPPPEEDDPSADTSHGATEIAVSAAELVGLDGPPPARTPDDAHTGRMLAVESLIAWGRAEEALHVAEAWNAAAPTDTLSWIAVARAHESLGDDRAAARSWGSLLDLHPTRVDVRRFVAGRLGGLRSGSQRLAIDAWRRSAIEQPHDAVVARGYAHALLRRGHERWAVEVLARAVASVERAAAATTDPVARRTMLGQLAELRGELAMIGGAALARAPSGAGSFEDAAGDRATIAELLGRAGATPDPRPTVRAILSWDTAGSDADLHVRDEGHVHAWYRRPWLGSGGVISGDASAWESVETLTLHGDALTQAHDVQVHWYALGPLGFGAGRLTVLRHDGHGSVLVEERPFVVTREHATVRLGAVTAIPDGSPRHHANPAHAP
jgi:hypothetical protein